MGHKKLHTQADELASSSYSVIKYCAAEVPKEYRNHILNKYLRGLQGGNDFFKLILPKSFFKTHEIYFNNLLVRPSAKIRIAVLTDSPDVILGWSLTEDKKLHYVYVRGENRRLGISSALLPDEYDLITHFTKSFIPIWHTKYPQVYFDPYEFNQNKGTK